jgi:peptidoglycan/xylan/chitin deacetylase (PgdA/CDA1 family)
MPISKAALLARVVDGTGLARMLANLARRPTLIVVTYHRIGDPTGNILDDGVYSSTTASFEKQICFLRNHFHVLTLPEFEEIASNNFQAEEPCALITFDDGYRDNIDLAFPVLVKHGLSAVFFITTNFVEHPSLPWWDRIAFTLKKTTRTRITLDLAVPLSIDLETMSRSAAIQKVLKYYKEVTDKNFQEFFKRLEDGAEVSLAPESLAHELFMRWEDVSRLATAGMGIGSHTHTHRILGHLSEAEQHQELALSKQLLESHLGRSIHSLSYPVGRPNVSFTNVTKQIAAEEGYHLAFSFEAGANLPHATDAFGIKRLGVENTESMSMFRTRIALTSSFNRSI